jgi:hypothetical protein
MNIQLSKEEVNTILEALEASKVFDTPLERLKNWSEYKQDAANRLKESKAILTNLSNKILLQPTCPVERGEIGIVHAHVADLKKQ